MRNAVVSACLAAIAAIAAPVRAHADTGPVIVMPGRPGVPVMINGRDASYAIVEGDWGLGKSTHMQPTVIRPWRVISTRPEGRYYPRTGHIPGYGRHEIEPPANRMLPPRAESFNRAWGIESANTPVTQYPPYEPPQIMIERGQRLQGQGDPPQPRGRAPGRARQLP